MASHTHSHYPDPVETESGAFFKVAALLLGFGVAVVAFFALMLWADARGQTVVESAPAGHDHAADQNTALPLQSFAGKTGEDAEALAQAHPAYDATLPPVAQGDVVKVQMTLKDMVVEVAPGVRYSTWAFDGHWPW